MTITGMELIRVLEGHGFAVQRQKGSHVRLEGPRGQHVTVPVHGSRALPKGTLILRDAGLSIQDIQSL